MSEESPLRASIVFTIGITPAPIVKFDRIACMRVQGGVFTPSLVANVASKDGYKEADFPVFSFEAGSEKAFEELRTLFHSRVDKAFDNYTKQWKDKYEVKPEQEPEPKKPELVKNEE